MNHIVSSILYKIVTHPHGWLGHNSPGHCERPKRAWQSPFLRCYEIASVVVLLLRNDSMPQPLKGGTVVGG